MLGIILMSGYIPTEEVLVMIYRFMYFGGDIYSYIIYFVFGTTTLFIS